MDKMMEKRNILWSAALLLAAASCSQEKGYELKGFVPEAWEGKQAVLYTIDTGKRLAFDSTEVRNGEFVFKGHFDRARLCNVTVYLNPKDRRSFDMTPSFKVFLDSTEVRAEAVKAKKGMTFEMTGGASMTDWMEYRKGLDRLSLQRKALFDDYIEVFYQNEARREGIDAALAVSRKAKEMEEYRIDYIRAHPSSMISVQVLDEVLDHAADLTRVELLSLYDVLSEKVKATEQAKAVHAAIVDKRILKGEICPDVMVQDREGKERSLSGCLVPGKYTLVEIWASWCSPCRGEIPFIKRAYQEYHKKGLEIVSISINEKRDDWEKALDQEKMAWTQLLDSPQKSFEVFETNAGPASLLVGPDGRIFKTNARGGWLDAALEEIYDN